MKEKKVNFKVKRFVAIWLLIMAIITVATSAFAAENPNTYNGGFAMTLGDITVYDSSACTTKKGKIFANESFTVLKTNVGNSTWYVEYNTSSGVKDGYIKTYDSTIFRDFETSTVAKMNQNATVYYGPSSSTYIKTGTIYSGENIVIIARTGNWAYVEYNAGSGLRKRGYIAFSSCTPYHQPSYGYEALYTTNSGEDVNISGFKYVYAGPSTKYAQVGSVNGEDVTLLGRFRYDETGDKDGYYIEYIVNGTKQKKSGFVFDIYD